MGIPLSAFGIASAFQITLETGETVTWDVGALNAAARAGDFGPPRYAATADLPPADWSHWSAEDRAKVDHFKTAPTILDEPAIAIEAEHPDFMILCFADGQHRITARQELRLSEIIFYLVPTGVERSFRITFVVCGA